jgi:hypothetical protein
VCRRTGCHHKGEAGVAHGPSNRKIAGNPFWLAS